MANQLDGTHKAALLLLGMEEKQAADILKHMPPKQIQKVGIAMAQMANSSASSFKEVVSEFIGDVNKYSSIRANTDEFLTSVMVRALGEEKATSFIERITEGHEDAGLDRLRWLDVQTIADLLRNEHPQVIATILTFLDPEQSASVLLRLDESKRINIVIRMSEMKSVKPEALEELGTIIESKLAGQQRRTEATVTGLTNVAELMNHLDSQNESMIMDGITDYNEGLVDLIKEKMFVFDDLVMVDDRSIQTLIQKVQQDDLLLALKGSDEKVQDKVFKNMSKRAADILRDDLEAQGPVKVTDVEDAQKRILAVGRALAEEGEITLGKGAEEMI